MEHVNSASHCDLIVLGAGFAGIAAAITAARSGQDILLVEQSHRIGGNVTRGLIHTLAGLYDAAGCVINPGLSEALIQRLAAADPSASKRRIGRAWVFNVNPEIVESVLESWISELKIPLIRRASVSSILRKSDGFMVTGAAVTGAFAIRSRCLIDATGDAAAISMIRPDAVRRTEPAASPGLIMRLAGCRSGDLTFPRNVQSAQRINVMLRESAISSRVQSIWLDRGLRDDEAYAKINLALPDSRDGGPSVEEVAGDCLCMIRRAMGSDRVALTRCSEICRRSSRHIQGEYRLTPDDMHKNRRFDGRKIRCAWPVEHWDAIHGLSLKYLAQKHYEIPAACLRIPGLKRTWVAGRCLSADHLAQSSARVAGTCWAMGEMAGKETIAWI